MISGDIKRVQWPRTTTTSADEYVGASGEMMMDVNRNELRLHDGRTRGGWRIPNLTQLRRLFVSTDSDLGEVRFADNLVGFMVRTANRTWRLRKFVSTEGVILSNLDGVAGDITLSLPDRLSAAPTSVVTDCNSVKSSGFYIVDSAASNLPGVLDSGDAAMTVVAGPGTGADLKVLQRIITVATDTNTEYTRRFRSGAWTAWA